MTFVIITAGIDLSVGSMMALSSVCTALAIRGVEFPARQAGMTLGISVATGGLVGLCVAGRQMQAGRRNSQVLAWSFCAWRRGVGVAIMWLLLGGHRFAPASPLVAVMLGIAAVVLAGWLNGSLVTALGLPPFIVTLATLVIFRGCAGYCGWLADQSG